jgi:hypothetical protein
MSEGTRLRIVSDGTAAGTRVETEDGTLVKGIQGLVWSLQIGGAARVHLDVLAVPVNLIGLQEGDGSLPEDPQGGFVVSEPQEAPKGVDFPPPINYGFRCPECGLMWKNPETECSGAEEGEHQPVRVSQDPEVWT